MANKEENFEVENNDVIEETITDEINKDIENNNENDLEVEDQNVINESNESEKVIEDLKKENEELEDKVLRLQAEISNMQRRNTIDRQNNAKYRSQKLASELIEVLDNLERALSTEITSEDGKSLKDGIEMVHKQFVNAFEKENITTIDPLGEEFDPNVHQAVSMMPGNEDQPSNSVINVLQKGYKLEDRVIRPAMVIVAE